MSSKSGLQSQVLSQFFLSKFFFKSWNLMKIIFKSGFFLKKKGTDITFMKE